MLKKYRSKLLDFLPEKVEEACSFIQEHVPVEGYFVGFSGGKDSVVLAKLVELSGVKHQLWYSCTGIDPPEVVKFIRKYYPECNWAYPKMTFWKGILTKSPPGIKRRWCCDLLKKNPTKNVPLLHRLMGVRLEESVRRSKYPRVHKRSNNQIMYYPLFYWSDADIWEFIDKNKLPYCSLYDEGFNRLGCIICPFRNKQEHEFYRKRYPEIYRLFDKTVVKWYNLKVKQGKTPSHPTAQEYLSDWYTEKGMVSVENSPRPKKIKQLGIKDFD